MNLLKNSSNHLNAISFLLNNEKYGQDCFFKNKKKNNSNWKISIKENPLIFNLTDKSSQNYYARLD